MERIATAMTPGPHFLTSRATARGLIIAAIVTGVLGLVARLALAQHYRGFTGFTPFDLQHPLSVFMMAVELGAFDEGTATVAYLFFAVVDFAFVIATAWLFTLFWTWLFVRSPTRLSGFLVRGGILLLPSYVVVLDLAAKAGFVRLLAGLEGQSYAATMEFCATVHRLKFAVIDIRNGLTAALLILVVIAQFAKQRPRRSPTRAPFPS